MDSGVLASQIVSLRRDQAAEPAGSAGSAGQVQASGQILTFEPGLYAVDIRGKGKRAHGAGFSLPCARLDPIQSGAGRATVATLSDGGWLAFADQTMFLNVSDAPVDVLLTTYRAAGALQAPELTIKAVHGVIAAEAMAVADAERREAGQALPAVVAAPLTLMAHVEQLGDVFVGLGEWIAAPSGHAIEGIRIETQGHLAVAKLEYRAIYAEGWQTPWFGAGEFCGSRGMSLPFRGFRVRLVGDAAAQFSCSYWGRFADGTELGPVFDGAACENLGQTLCSLRVQVTEKAAVALDPALAAALPGRARPRGRMRAKTVDPAVAGDGPVPPLSPGGKRRRSRDV